MKFFKFKFLVYFIVVAGIICLGLLPQKALATTYVSGTLTKDTQWVPKKSPYVVGEGFIVPSNITLTIKPGVVVKFDQASQVPTILGIIKAIGTESKPIYFTSLNDDSIGGDTNGDGQSSSPSIYGDWSLVLGDSSTLQLSQSGDIHKERENGEEDKDEDDSDHEDVSGSTFENASFRYMRSITITSRMVNVEDSKLVNSGSGFSIDSGARLMINGLDSSNVDNSILVAYGNTFIDAKKLNFDLEQSNGNAIVLLDSAKLNLSNSNFIKNKAGEAVLVMFGSDATVTNSSLQNNQGEGILLFNNFDLSRPSTLKLNKSFFKNMGQEAILLFDGSNVNMEDVQLSNLSQAGLGLFDSLAALSNVSFSNGNDVGIELFDSYRMPQTSSLTADSLVIKNFKAAGILSFNSTANIKNSTLSSNYEGIEAYVGNRPASDEAFEITGSKIINNDFGINVYSNFAPTDPPYLLQAKNNWWGNSSGPFHSTLNAGGIGDMVSDNVAFAPWLSRLKEGGQKCKDSEHEDSCGEDEDGRHDEKTDEQKDSDKEHSRNLYERAKQIKKDKEDDFRKIKSHETSR